MKTINTIILGAGPSGLSCSYYLMEHNIEHMIIEKNEIMNSWKNQRWDSFTLVTPNWMTRLPGVEDMVPKNNEYMTKDEINRTFDAMVDYISPNVYDKTTVIEIAKKDDIFTVITDKGTFYSYNVIVAIGLFNNPFIPPCSKNLDKNILQIDATKYKNPFELPDGNVIVVGSGRSGVQIAYEIKRLTDKEVFLSIGSLKPIPEIYRQTNGVFWLNRLSGFTEHEDIVQYTAQDTTNSNILSKLYQNLGLCNDVGVNLVGRFNFAHNNDINFGDNLKESLREGEDYLKKMRSFIDEHIDAYKLALTDDMLDFKIPNLDVDNISSITHIDTVESNIGTVIWCTGFRPDYSFIKADVFDSTNRVIHNRGVTACKGLYFSGQELDPGFGEKSSFGIGLFAIRNDARFIVDNIINSK